MPVIFIPQHSNPTRVNPPLEVQMKTSLSAALAVLLAACGSVGQQAPRNDMSFFVTSAGPGRGADLGGLQGADRHCQALAQAAGAGQRTWRAYLSESSAGA